MDELTDITAYNLTGQQVRDILGIQKLKFLDLVHSGELDAITVGSHFRISEASVRAYIERHRFIPDKGRAAS